MDQRWFKQAYSFTNKRGSNYLKYLNKNLILCIRDFDARGAIGFKTLLNFAPAFIGELLGMDYSSRASQGIQSLPYVGRFNLPTAYGSIGVKVWIFKGDIMEHDPSARDKKLAELKDNPSARMQKNTVFAQERTT